MQIMAEKWEELVPLNSKYGLGRPELEKVGNIVCAKKTICCCNLCFLLLSGREPSGSLALAQIKVLLYRRQIVSLLN